MMETSKPASLPATPGEVRAGADRQAENPSGAAIWTRSVASRNAEIAHRYQGSWITTYLTGGCPWSGGARHTGGNQGGTAGVVYTLSSLSWVESFFIGLSLRGFGGLPNPKQSSSNFNRWLHMNIIVWYCQWLTKWTSYVLITYCQLEIASSG